MSEGAGSGGRVLGGTVRVFAAEALMFPTGLLTVAFLTRRLGTEGYGAYALIAVLITWVEFSVGSLFSRAALKFVGEADDWRSAGTAMARWQLGISAGVAAGLVLAAGPIARVLGAAELAGNLRWFALDIPLCGLAAAHRNVVVGIGAYSQRAWMSVARWTSRLLFIVLFVELGGSVTGAVLGSVAASGVELLVGRRCVRLPLRSRASFPLRRFLAYALPLSAVALGTTLFGKIDLFLLKALGGELREAGLYGAAQNLALVFSVFGGTFAALLLARLSNRMRWGDLPGARTLMEAGLSTLFFSVPAVAVIVGCGSELAVALFGPGYAEAGPLLGLLAVAAFCFSWVSLATACLTAVGSPSHTLAVVLPLLPVAMVAHVVLIPRFGAVGAASVTAGAAFAAGFGSLWTARRRCGLQVKPVPVLRSLGAAVVVGGLAWLWPASGPMLAVKLTALAALAFGALWITGGWGRREADLIRSLLRPSSPERLGDR